MAQNGRPPSRHAKDYLGSGCSWPSSGGSGIVENQDTAVAEWDFHGLPGGALVAKICQAYKKAYKNYTLDLHSHFMRHLTTADRQVGSSANNGYLVRIIEFEDPATGKNHRFITNEMTLAPGLLAHLYRMRWDIEKAFDEIKNRLNQKKAWATSSTAKSMQGHFIALAHNLMLLLGEALKSEDQIEDKPELKRRKARRELERESGRKRRFVDELSIWLLRATQRGVKFIRWLRANSAIQLRGRKPARL